MTFNHTEIHMRSPIPFVLLLLGIVLTAPRPAAAQQFGILGGVNFAEVTGDDVDEDLDGSTGFLLGLFGRVGLGEIITFQPEVQYAQKGAQSETAVGDFEAELSYIDVPLFLSFGFPNSFHALVAPRFSFEVSCEIDFDSTGGIDFEGDCDEDDGEFDSRNSFLVGGTVGVGIDLPLGGLDVFLDGRFDIDLESFAEDEDVDVKNRAFQIVGGVRFGSIDD
jgi:hypothetical protein